MGLSITFLGLIVLMNSLFVANYFIIRSLRLSIETSKILKSKCGENNDEDEEESLSCKEKLLKNKHVRRILITIFGPLLALYFRIKDQVEAKAEEARKSDKAYTPMDEKLAFVGYIKKKNLQSEDFQVGMLFLTKLAHLPQLF